MKNTTHRLLCLGLALIVQLSFLFAYSNPLDSMRLENPIDSIIAKKYIWPDCPTIENIKAYNFIKNEVIVSWDGITSNNIEYEIEVSESINKSIINRSISNTTNTYFKVDKENESFDIRVRSNCYEENSNKIIIGEWVELQVMMTPPPGTGSASICDSYLDFIDIDNDSSTGSSTYVFDNVPQGIEAEITICYTDTTSYITTCEVLNSSSSNQGVIVPENAVINIDDISFTSSSGTTSCEDQNLLDWNSTWCSNYLTSVYNFEIVNGVPELVISTSLDWAGTGSLTYTQGGQSTTIVGNSSTFSSASCDPVTICVSFTSSVACNGESCQFTFDPCDLPPVGPPVPPCIDPPCSDPPTCDDIMINSVGYNLSNFGEVCFVSFDSEYDFSGSLGYLNDGNEVSVSISNTNSMIIVPSGTLITYSQTIEYTDENNEEQTLVCKDSFTTECEINDDPPLVGEDCNTVTITQNSNCDISWTVNPADLDVYMIATTSGGVSEVSTSGELSQQQISNNPTRIDYIITSTNDDGDLEVTECSFIPEVCDVDTPLDMCDYFTYEIDTEAHLPQYFLSWSAAEVEQLALTIYINGEKQNISTGLFGGMLINPGDVIEFSAEITQDGSAEECAFNFDAPPLEPDTPIDLDEICEYFDLIQGFINSDNSFDLTIANGDESQIENALSDMGIDLETLEDWLSQIETVDVVLKITNDENASPILVEEPIYENPNSGQYNGPSSLFFDPVNWSFNFNGISTNTLVVQYEIEVTDFEGNSQKCGFNDLLLDQVEEIIETPNEFVELNCGDQVATDFTSTAITTESIKGEVITIHGFPILITEANESSPFDGSGIIALPFERAQVLIEFENLVVNDNFKVISGQIFIPDDNPANHDNFHLDNVPLNIGGDICIPPPAPTGQGPGGINSATGLDQYGFNPESGLHEETNDIYDKNGFDIEGNHKDTGDPYNDFGCDRNGMSNDVPPVACDPSNDDVVIADFINEEGENIVTDAETILKDLVQAMKTERDALPCGDIRNEVINLYENVLEYNEDFIVGVSKEFLDPGMSRNFKEAPQKLVTQIEGRDENTILLEEKHIELYNCDKEYVELDDAIILIVNMCDDPLNTDLNDHIINLIENWGSYDKERYINDPVKLQEWLVIVVEEFVNNRTGRDQGIGFIENPLEILPELNSIFKINAKNSMASTASTTSVFFSEDELFQVGQAFARGDKFINDIPRAFYIEKLAELAGGGGSPFTEIPISVSKQIGSFVYTVYVGNISIDAITGGLLDAHFIIEDTNSGKKFSFSGHDIAFGPGEVDTNSKLSLDTDVNIRLNNATMLKLKGTDLTFVEWSCKGFERMGIDLRIEFCRNIIVPMDDEGLPLEDPARFELELNTTITEWLEFTFDVSSTTPFAMAKYENIIWNFDNVVVDMSSTLGGGIQPIEGYQSEFLEGDLLTDEWKGFYIGELSVVIPNTFSKDEDAELLVTANDIIIDGSGVTGETEVSSGGSGSILSTDEGNLSGWAFGIDYFGLRVINNHVAGGKFGGLINVPLFEEFMEYDAQIYPGNHYSFTVSPLEDATVNMFKGTAVIDKNSSISVTYSGDDEFHAYADLTGKLSLGIGGQGINVEEIAFNNLGLSNQSPYFSGGNWELKSDISANFSGFSLSVGNIKAYKPGNVDEEAGVNFDIALKLGDDIKGLDASGGMGIVGKLLLDDEGIQRWVYDRLEPNEFCLSSTFPGVERISMCLNWYEGDAVYGTGFQGFGNVSFKGVGASIEAVGQFGKLPDYKYFFIDAMVNLNIGLGVEPLTIYGFGGGLSHHMINNFNPGTLNYSGENQPGFGSSLSGVLYTPNKDIGLGLKASIAFELAGKRDLFNGLAELGAFFNAPSSGGGLSSMYFQGFGQLLNSPMPFGGPTTSLLNEVPESYELGKNSKPNLSSPMSAYAYFEYNTDGPSFTGDMGVFLDAGSLQGASDGMLAHAKLEFSPQGWFLNIGTPDKKGGAILSVPLLGTIDLKAYFCTGTEIPSIPSPPASVKDIANKYVQNLALLQPGAGLVFGASLGVDIEVSVVGGLAGGSFSALAGFDVMIKRFKNVFCDGEGIGIDGWYANGQAYAKVEGVLKIMGVNVFSAGLATILEARLPNPTLLTGTAGIRFKVGPFTVNKSLQFNLGNNCVLTTNGEDPGLGMDAIAYLDPTDTSIGVPTDKKPKIIFNLAIGRTHPVTDFNGNVHNYKVELDYESLKLETVDGYEIPFSYKLASNNMILEIEPAWMLPGSSDMKLEASVVIYKGEEVYATETKTALFTTQEGYDHIPLSNIEASYPSNGMVNFYKDEYTKAKGYIILDEAQPELFYGIPDELDQKLRITSSDGTTMFLNYSLDPYSNKIDFDLPSQILDNSSIYKIELVRLPSPLAEKGSDLDSKVLLTMFFRVSDFNTFQDKIDAIKNTSLIVEENALRGTAIYYNMQNIESFDIKENIDFKFDNVYNNNWYNTNYKNSFYKHLPMKSYGSNGWGLTPFENTSHLKNESVELTNATDITIDTDAFAKGSSSINDELRNQATKVKFVYAKIVAQDINLSRQIIREAILAGEHACIAEVREGCATREPGGEGSEPDGGCDESEFLIPCLDQLIDPNVRNLEDDIFIDIPSDSDYKISVSYKLPGSQTNSRISKLIYTK